VTNAHHTRTGFRNNHDITPRGSFWRWQRERWSKKLPKAPPGGYRVDSVKPDVQFLKANRSEPVITWLGHATFLLQMGGVNILTDPHLTGRASPFAFSGPKRVVPPALAFHDLPHIDIVVISHNHYDHLDRGTVRHLMKQAGGSARFFVPLGLKAWMSGTGYAKCVELDWWQWVQDKGLTFHFVPAQHWSARTPWDRNKSLWGGWIIDHPDFRFFFAGDTGYSPDFLEIGRRFAPIDLAALPIGAYEPRWFMGAIHVNPEEAVKIHQDIGARHSVGMHWGTFVLTDEPFDEPPHRLALARRAAGLKEEEFFVMKHGETRLLQTLGRPKPSGPMPAWVLEAAARLRTA
jgi:N-acyl-phosphatidylethanolamine-hydrolysing phospholipase D